MTVVLVLAAAAFLLAAGAYLEAVNVRDRLNAFIEDMERELNDL